MQTAAVATLNNNSTIAVAVCDILAYPAGIHLTGNAFRFGWPAWPVDSKALTNQAINAASSVIWTSFHLSYSFDPVQESLQYAM